MTAQTEREENQDGFHVSVIIPVYNSEPYIETAVRSVLNQPELTELLLIDDGSTDSSVAICRKLQEGNERIKIFTHEGNKNKGVSASRNLGIKNAGSEFIAFLDADDHYLPGRFTTASQIFKNDHSVDGVYEMTGIHSDDNAFKPYTKIEQVRPDVLFENLQPLGEKVWFSSNGLTVKRALFERAGLFDESLRTSEDTLQWFRLAASGKLVSGNIASPVSIARSRPDSLTADKAPVQKDFILMLLKLFRYCTEIKCSPARKELVLEKLFFFSSQPVYAQHFTGLKKMALVAKIIGTDPAYVLWGSPRFRRYIGTLIGFNKLRDSTAKHHQ